MATSLSGIGGIWPATLTPFDADGRVDEAALARHIADVAGVPGVRALAVNGHAGETSTLSRAERALAVRIAVRAAGGVPIVAGIVADDVRSAIELAVDAAEAGASGLLVFPPPVFAQGAEARPEMALRFLHDLAAATPLPLVLFQLSRPAGQGFSTALLTRLCTEIPQIIAIKEGSDLPQAYEDNLRALRRIGRPITILSTNNSWLMASLAYGGDGILSGMGSVAAPLLVALHAAMAAGQLDEARRVNDRLVPLCRVFYRAPGADSHSRMKIALHLLGRLPAPDPRPPLLPIDAAERVQIRAALVAAGLLAEEQAHG